jgi:M6 family metalloprotease-like protein
MTPQSFKTHFIWNINKDSLYRSTLHSLRNKINSPVIAKIQACLLIILLIGSIFIPSIWFSPESAYFSDDSGNIRDGVIDAYGNDQELDDFITINNPALEIGYELAPIAPEAGFGPQPKETPHPNGIPPITQKYKDPAYIGSQTRSGAPTVINETVLLILVNFTSSGITIQRPVSQLEDAVFNKTPGAISVHNYYKEVSYGVVNIDPGVQNGAAAGKWLDLPSNRTYYGRDKTSGGYVTDDGWSRDGQWWTQGKVQLVIDACNAADAAGVDFGKYDNDGPDGIPNSTDDDGIVDHVLLIFSGNGQNHYGRDTSENSGPDDNGGANDYGRDLIWPSRIQYSMGTYDTKQVIGATLNPEDPDYNVPVGVICHEFGHDLGLPDLYDTDGSTNAVVGKWELMDSGTYNTNSSGAARPAHPGAWCKEQLGWIDPIVINESNNNQGVVQVNHTAGPTNDSVCYKIKIENENEYYLVENRNKTKDTYDEGLSDRGILIWHIDDDMNPQGSNRGPPTYTYYPILLENYKNDANAENYITSMNTACWKSSGTADQADFNVTTTPNSSANGGTPSGIFIDRIKDNALWNMTVRILVSEDSDLPGPPKNLTVIDAENDNGHIINLTWNASADDGNNDDDVLFYNIMVNETGSIYNPKEILQVIAATDSPSYSVQVPDLIDGVTYNFTVLADDGPNVSPFPGNFTVVPIDNIATPPTSVSAVDTYPDDGLNITLSWSLSDDDPMGAGFGANDVIYYNISMGLIEGAGKSVIATLNPGNTSYRVENLTNGITYYFLVTAVDDVFNEGDSIEVNATPIDDYVGSPKNLQVLPPSWSNNTQYIIQWVNPIENSYILEAFYKLDSAPTSNNDFTGNSTGAGIYWLWITDPLTDGTHLVYIWLRDKENNTDYTTARFVTIRHDRTPPASPQNPTVNPVGWSKSNLFSFTWKNPPEVSGYQGLFYSINKAPRSNFNGYYAVGSLESININYAADTIKGENTLYIWLYDNANNVNYTTNISIKYYYDPDAPGEPDNIQVTPDSWTNVNTFDVSWTNPSDLSGIVGVRYKLDQQPFSNSEGTYVPGINISSIKNIQVSDTGSHTLYLWLVDNASNANYGVGGVNYTWLYFDDTPPSPPINLQTLPSYWSSTNDFYVNWTWSSYEEWDQSSISGVYYKFGDPPNSSNDGNFIAGFEIKELYNISVPMNGSNELHLWLQDQVGNVNHLNYSTIKLYYDGLAPSPPIALTPHPTNIWTRKNNYSVSWTNPDEDSGIGGAYYKLDTPPASNYDGIYIERNWINHIDDIKVNGAGAHAIYVWLFDRMGNINYMNYSTVDLLFDNLPPGPPINITVSPGSWTSTNSFNISWDNPPEHSGIYGLYYWFSPPDNNIGSLIIKDEISSLTDFQLPGDDPPANEYSLYIWLIDNAFNINYKNNNSGKILYDVRGPYITHTRVYYATDSFPVTITAIVEDDLSGVDEVKLHYKQNKDTVYQEITMDRTGGSVYQGEIPAEKVTGDYLGYFISVSDKTDVPNIRYYAKEGQVRYKPGANSDIDIQILDEDVIPPTIIHQKVTSGIAGTKLALTATVTDDGSGVKDVKVFYKSKSDKSFIEGQMLDGEPYYYEFPEYIMTTAGVEYYLYAVDNSPKSNDIYYGNYGQTNVKPNTNDSYILIDITAVDNSPPKIIFGPEVKDVTATTVTVYWITNEPSDSEIEFDTDTDLSIHGFNTSYVTLHSLFLIDLTPDTLYYYRVSSTDRNNKGPTFSNMFTFKTMKIGEEDTDGDGTPDSTDLDDDDDGIPDTWEEQYQMNPKDPKDAEMDFDNDGFSSLLEYLSDSDPNDPNSTPSSIVDKTPPYIIHEPRAKTNYLESMTISAQVNDNGSGVRNVTLHFKSKRESKYTSVSMIKKSDADDIYSYVVTRERITMDDMEYFIEASDWAVISNRIYFGDNGITDVRPDQDSDIDVDVQDKTGASTTSDDDSDDNFLGDLGEPFGLTNPVICLVVLIILIVLFISFLLSIRSAMRARAMANKAVKAKSETADGERWTWEGEEYEELDEVEDLSTTGEEDHEMTDDL